MSPGETQALTIVLDLVKTGGITAILFIVLWAFYTGKLISRAVYEDLTSSIVEQVLERLVPHLKDVVKPAVDDAVREAFERHADHI